MRAGGVPGAGERLQLRELCILTVSLGLLTGLAEGTALLLLQRSGWAGENVDCLLVPRGILYVSPLVNVVLFVTLGFLAAGICRVSRGWVPPQFPMFLLIMMVVFDWLALTLDRLMNPPAIAILSAGVSAVLLRAGWSHRERLVRAIRAMLPVFGGAAVLLAAGIPILNQGVANASDAGQPTASRGAANVLLIVMDTVRADHVSALGYRRRTTPNLDGLATQGVLFENAFSTSSWTLPAHASLLTGRFPFEHGAEVKMYDGRYPTLPEVFEERGYRTGAFSANTYYFAGQNGFSPGFQRFDGTFTNLADAVTRTLYGRYLMMLYERMGRPDLPGRKPAALVNAHFLDWLQQDSSRPFFAVLNYFDAHDPYLPPGPFRGRFAGRPDVGGVLNGWASREALERPSDVRDESDAYDGGIAYEDDRIGDLLAGLEKRGLAQDTLLVVVSDHGEFFGEHGLYLHKNALYLQGIHVPLLLVWPGHLPPGVRVAAPVSIANVAATILNLLPGTGRMEFPGPSLAPLWSGSGTADDGELILSELVANIPPPSGGEPPRTESLLNTRWHFIYTRGEGPQLYEWKEDPGENHNLAGTPAGQRVVSAMLSCLDAHLSRIRQPECGFTAGELGEESASRSARVASGPPSPSADFPASSPGAGSPEP